MNETRMILHVAFTALQDIALDSKLLGKDAFRFLTLSSMYSSASRYDGNVIRFKKNGEVVNISLTQKNQRGYIIEKDSPYCSEFGLLKETGSAGKPYTPGSPDSPSFQVKVLESSVPGEQLCLQAYLSESTNVNDDSLSVWLEWRDCPAVLEKGQEVSLAAEISALPPL